MLRRMIWDIPEPDQSEDGGSDAGNTKRHPPAIVANHPGKQNGGSGASQPRPGGNEPLNASVLNRRNPAGHSSGARGIERSRADSQCETQQKKGGNNSKIDTNSWFTAQSC